MRIKYRGKQKGWRIYLRKGAVQIDLGGRSPNKKWPVVSLAVWDDHVQGFVTIEQYKYNNQFLCDAKVELFDGSNADAKLIDERILYLHPRLNNEANNKMTKKATIRYLKEKRKKEEK